MIEKQLIVSPRIPPPARKLLNLVQQLLKLAKQPATRVIQQGGVRVNGRVLKRLQEELAPGDRLDIAYEPELVRPAKGQEEQERVEIVFQDEHLLVVNKPPHLLTVPTPRQEKHTLISLLNKRLARERAGEQAYCIHRLDRGVSGLLVFGRRLEVAQLMRDQFAERKPLRRYVAIVAGALVEQEGTFRSHLATDKDLNRYSTEDTEQGELAITHYRVLQSGESFTVVEVWLETGRRNQIRVHFAEAGHPVLGDTRYGSRQLEARWPHKRIALHAQRLGFTHPFTGRSLSFESPLPWEIQSLMAHSSRTKPQ